MSSIRDKLTDKKSKLALPKEKISDHPAQLNNYEDGGFYQVEIDSIQPDPNQPRKYFDPQAQDELTESIRKRGVLQPVIIRKDHDNKIYLVAGERRYRGAKQAGLTTIPAILTTGNPMEISLIENLQRDDLKPVEEAEALGRMVDEYNYTHENLAQALGKARTTITETLSLNKLPEEIKEVCRSTNAYSRRLLVEVAKQTTSHAMMALFKQIQENQLTSSQVREITRKRFQRKTKPPAVSARQIAQNLLNTLHKIDWNDMEENEKIKLVTILNELQLTLNKMLNS
jgi:ParB family chromosome partitioning protein